MSILFADRVSETTLTTGTGTLTLAGAVAGFQSFSSAFTDADQVYYAIQDGTDWEVGAGTYSAGTLSRDTIYTSSNADSAVSWGSGSKTVFVTLPAVWANIVRGDDGATWLSGAAAPDDLDGVDGDFYFRSSNGDVHTKAAGTWGAAIANLTGPQGPQGDPGIQGDPGPAGPSSFPGNAPVVYSSTPAVAPYRLVAGTVTLWVRRNGTIPSTTGAYTLVLALPAGGATVDLTTVPGAADTWTVVAVTGTAVVVDGAEATVTITATVDDLTPAPVGNQEQGTIYWQIVVTPS